MFWEIVFIVFMTIVYNTFISLAFVGNILADWDYSLRKKKMMYLLSFIPPISTVALLIFWIVYIVRFIAKESMKEIKKCMINLK